MPKSSHNSNSTSKITVLNKSLQNEIVEDKKIQVENTSIIPSSSSVHLAYRTLIAGNEKIGELTGNILQSTNNKVTAAIERKGDMREITQTRSGGIDTIIVEDINLLQSGRQGSSARKMLVYILSEIAQQVLNNGEPTKTGVLISYEDLVKAGLYASKKTASRGVENAFNVLSSLKIKGYSVRKRKGKDVKLEQEEAGVLFYHMSKTNKGSVIISINEHFNWFYLVQFYTMIPNVYYKLKSTASDLFFYIFYLARQKHEEISKTQTFTISMRAIQNYLMLPDEEIATNPTHQIKKPIEEAVGNILDCVPSDLLEIKIERKEYSSIKEYLNGGVLIITLKGEYLKYFSNYFNKIEKANWLEEKRRLNNLNKAQQKALQKKLEAEADTTQKTTSD